MEGFLDAPGIGGAGQIAGVLAEQVVQPVAALGRLGQQVLVIQRLQAAAGGRQVGAVQGGGGVASMSVPGCRPSRRNGRC